MKTSEMLARLKTLATKAGDALFERVGLAAKVLADKEWLDAEFTGDYEKALAFVETDCFPELTAFGLSRLIELHGAFPAIGEWRQRKFNLRVLWAEHQERQAEANGREKQTRTVVKKADLEIVVKERDEARWGEKHAKEMLGQKETEIEKLRREKAELEHQLAVKEGEIAALNRMLEQQRQTAAR